MTNPAKEIREQIQQQWPGATVSKRWRNGIELAHPDTPQRRALTATIGPIHYGANESQEIDTAWLPSADAAWQWQMTENDYHAHSRDVFNSGNLIRYTHAASGLWVQFDPQSLNWRNEDNSQHQIAIKEAVTAIVEDDVLRWPAAWGAGRHFQFQAQTGRLQKLLTIDSTADLPEPTVTGDIVLELEYSLNIATGLSFWIDGQEWTRANNVRVSTANHIECRNSTGETLFWIAPPTAWDSAGNETVGLLQVRRAGGPTALFINARIPRSWIETAQFPIHIDPTVDVRVGAGADDGRITNTAFASTGSLIIGRWSTSNVYRTWLVFNFGAINTVGKTINTCYLQLTSTSNESVDTVRAKIQAELAVNPIAPTSYADWDGRTRTTAAVNWDDLGHWVTNVAYDTPELKIVAQEVFDLDIESLTSMHWFVDDNGSSQLQNCWRVPFNYEQSTTKAARLYIEYTEVAALSAELDATLDDATLSATALLPINAQLDVTLDNATLSATALLPISAQLDTTLDDATLSATALLPINAQLDVTLDNATLSATALLPISAQLDATLDDATLTAAADVADILSASLDLVLDDATLSASALLPISAQLDATLDDATLTATAESDDTLSAELVATLDDATLSATALLPISVQLDTTLDDATLSATALLPISAQLDASLDDATLTAAADVADILSAALDLVLDDATLSATALLPISAQLDATLADATLTATGTVGAVGQIHTITAQLSSRSALATIATRQATAELSESSITITQ
jgi:hypothetical protein